MSEDFRETGCGDLARPDHVSQNQPGANGGKLFMIPNDDDASKADDSVQKGCAKETIHHGKLIHNQEVTDKLF